MKVKELIEELQKMDPQLNIVIYDDSDARGLEIVNITETHLTQMRDPKGVARMKFGKGPESTKHACIEITSDI
tara:strand:- start:388 stop:606 length:219 start_codon:yes stop_codon:yes gene_type:complete